MVSINFAYGEITEIETLFNKGTAFLKEGSFEEADSIFKSILDEEPNHVGTIIGKGKVFAEQGNFYEAIPYFVKARQIEPENEIAKLNLEISPKQLVYAKVEGSIEIQLRDSNGFLVALLMIHCSATKSKTVFRPCVRCVSVSNPASTNGFRTM